MKRFNKSILAVTLSSLLCIAGCSDGDDGSDGADGAPGAPGEPGSSIGNTTSSVASAADLMLTLAPSDIVVTGTDAFQIKFTAAGTNAQGQTVPFSGLDKIAIYVTNQAANDTEIGSPLLWTNHAMANDAGYSMYCTPEGTTTSWGAEVDACTLVEDADNPGTYTGTWEHEGAAPIILADGDVNNLHRVMIRTYDLVDANGDAVDNKALSAVLDFIPATGELAISEKDSVSNESCIKCHGEIDGYPEGEYRISNIEAHHNYQQVENCIACHNPAIAGGEDDPAIGFNADFGPMIHRLHAGHNIEEMLEGEAAEMFGHIGYPAELTECTVCHDGEPTWAFNITADACESCHIDVDFATGEGHSQYNLAQSDDGSCAECHGSGGLSPAEAHKIGRRDDMVAAKAFVVEVQKLEVIDNGINDDFSSTLRATSKVTMNGADPADDLDFTPYMTNSDRGLLIGNVDANGTVTRGMGMKVTTGGGNFVSLTDGILITEMLVDDARLTGTLYATAEVQVCGDGTQTVECGSDEALTNLDGSDFGFANDAPINYIDLDGGEAITARIDDPSRTTIDESTCNACHDNLTHVKSTHGASDFNQCMDCHNETWGGSFHSEKTALLVDDDGEFLLDNSGEQQIIETLDTYGTRDLVTVAHRYHSGAWDNGSAVGVYLVQYPDGTNETHGYSAPSTDCEACHIEDVQFFAADGGLFSGKRAMSIGDDEFISPVSEACRSCHQHSTESALAHFKSNGAYTLNDAADTENLPVESCAVCHAEGKTYGVDIMHAGGSH
ncbi:OmcA/MtrC family decaheme c-type cytochrome [Ferrimonas lipolytica]|uniref:OmcA/MtrC family decaheme c-type cytochrome n=2 Tax=Ferrimonas lipolytica TaxID=2724191 RepID=A0A6H1UKM8_9GAMM|nr:OmcA/MtrC family decaheme c-type cytochrome [Ferrimonas lipolytica]